MTAPIQVASEPVGSPESCAGMGHVLAEVTRLLDEARIPHLVFGGVASSALGRPRTTRDIDVLVRPDTARQVIGLLGEHGFETDLLDDKWIYKAYKHEVMVDVIFTTRFGIHLDEAALQHSKLVEYEGARFHSMSPEDLFIIKAISSDEASPRHWFDALGLILNSDFDWEYLVERARRAHRRVLSLLLYAQSIDYFIPDTVITQLMGRFRTD